MIDEPSSGEVDPGPGSLDGPPPDGGLDLDATLAADGLGAPEGADRPPSFPSPPVHGELERGTIVGRYVVLGRLGAGAMGIVYVAYDPELDRKVALKLLHPARVALGREGEAHRRLLREAQALARLSDPNVVTVHDVGEYEGRVYVAMAFVEGRTLFMWLKDRSRPWREVVRVFEGAGRGLAAAHAKGLVHRDFKPDNVMVGDDSQVWVMDFGLARPAGEQSVATRETGTPSPRSDALGTHVTRAGSLVGTPAYMAPEQWTGGDVGPKADQFGYCVAFWEALYGVRPFAGETPAALAFAVTQGKLAGTPQGRRVPRWLARVVRRGLALRPEDRWPSMDALLGALSRGQGRARLWAAAAGLGVLVLLGAGADGYRRYERARKVAACEGGGRAYIANWSGSMRERARVGLAATGTSYGAATAEKVLPYLDAQAEALRDAWTEVCIDAKVRETWTEELAARSQWCLGERRLELESLAEEFAQATPTVVREAVKAAGNLTRIERCRDADLLARLPAPPKDPEPVAAVHKTLSRAATLKAIGGYDEGLALAERALDAARVLTWPPLEAAAQYRVGELLGKKGRYGEAEAAFEEAYFKAMEIGALEVAFEAATGLVYTVGYRRARHEEGLRWGRHAELLLRTFAEPEDSLRPTKLLNSVASIYKRMGNFDRARELYVRVLAIREQALGTNHPQVAISLGNLANIYYDKGDYETARRLHERSLAIREKALGLEHPDVAMSLNNLAEAYKMMGDYEAARNLHERALTIREKPLGPEHPDVASSLANLATIESATGNYDRARELDKRALAIRERALGPEHPLVALSLTSLAYTHLATGDNEKARALYERALAIQERVFGPEHPRVASTLNNLAEVHRIIGNHGKARKLFERALDGFESILGPEHPHLAYPLTGLADVALAARDPASALRLAERAVVLRAGENASPEDAAESRFLLARALWDAPVGKGRDRERAVLEAQTAADLYRAVTGREKERAEVEAWLATHPVSERGMGEARIEPDAVRPAARQ